MGGFLIVLGVLGILVALVMFFVKIITKKGWSYKRILVLFVIAVVAFGVGGSMLPETTQETRKTEKEEANKTTQEVHKIEPQDRFVKHLGGYSKGNHDNGVIKISYEDNALFVDYRFYPVGISSIRKELGIQLASKIRKLYENESQIDTVIFNVYLPYQDKYGNEFWKPTAGFTMTRSIFDKINWNNFLTSNLLDIAEDVRVPE